MTVRETVDHPGPDTAAELTALAGWIDEQLGDETADRQLVAEMIADRIREMRLRMLGADAPACRGRPSLTGPFETDQQVRELPAVRAVYDAMHASHRRGIMGERNHRMLCEAVSAAGVELGEYDHHILLWLTNWEPETIAVLAGIISRAFASGQDPLLRTPRDRRTVLDALDVAAGYKRDRAASCPDCPHTEGGLCGTCDWRLTQAGGYDALAATLGGAR